MSSSLESLLIYIYIYFSPFFLLRFCIPASTCHRNFSFLSFLYFFIPFFLFFSLRAHNKRTRWSMHPTRTGLVSLSTSNYSYISFQVSKFEFGAGRVESVETGCWNSSIVFPFHKGITQMPLPNIGSYVWLSARRKTNSR